jgi:nitrate reductase gamma subunit
VDRSLKRALAILLLLLGLGCSLCLGAQAAGDATAAASPSAAAATAPLPWWQPGGLAHAELYDMVRGPAFLAAWVVFAAGLLYRVCQYVMLTTRGASSQPHAIFPAAAGFAGRGSEADDKPLLHRGRSVVSRAWLALRLRARRTILGSNPVMASVSLVFHLLLFLAPLLLPAHNILFDLAFGVSLPTLAEPVVDALTLVVVLACVFFLLRRVAVPRVRALTTGRDWLVLLLVAAPFVSAFLAYHQVLEYRVVLLVHMVVGELVIAAIPFSPIGHMPFLLFARLFAAGEYAWRPAVRRWR